LHEASFVRVWALPVKGTAVTLFAIPMNENIGSEIDYLMLRRRAKNTVFASVQEPWRTSTKEKVREILRVPVHTIRGRLLAEHEATALEVKLIDGTRHIFFVNHTHGQKKIGKVTTNADVAAWEVRKHGTINNSQHTKGSIFSVR